MRTPLLLIEPSRTAASLVASLSLHGFELRRVDSITAAWEAQCDEPAAVLLVGTGIARDAAVSFAGSVREQFPTTIALVASGDRTIDAMCLRLAADHVDACAELRRRIAAESRGSMRIDRAA